MGESSSGILALDRNNGRNRISILPDLMLIPRKPLAISHKLEYLRYGVKVEVAHPPNNWRCPSCRGICNCGRCMKEEGFEPVGIRGRVGKTARFLSVMERLAANSSKNINEVVDHNETKATEESVPGSDGRKDAGNSNSMEVHLSSEVNPRVGVEEEKSQSAGADVKNVSNFIKTVSSRNDVLSVLLSPSRSDYESLLQPSDSV